MIAMFHRDGSVQYAVEYIHLARRGAISVAMNKQ